MELVKPGTYVDFMRHRTPVVGASLVLVVLSIVSLFVPGPNYGIDFAGGTELQLEFEGDVPANELRTILGEMGHQGADVVSVAGSANEYMIRVQEVSSIPEAKQQAVEAALEAALGEGAVRVVRFSPGGDKLSIRLDVGTDTSSVESIIEGEGLDVPPDAIDRRTTSEDERLEVRLAGIDVELIRQLRERLGDRGPKDPKRTEWVGPKAGEQLRDAAVKSLLYAIAFIMVYVAFRFDLRFAPGGVLAMFHDAVITLGIYVLVQKEVNLTTVAALLTILGYSINDTIVVYDRIRENMGRLKDKSLRELINISTSQMLSRTIVTSGTTLLSVVAFFIWGTPVIKDISFALFCGILIGTYSSIYIAAPVTEYMDRRFFSKTA